MGIQFIEETNTINFPDISLIISGLSWIPNFLGKTHFLDCSDLVDTLCVFQGVDAPRRKQQEIRISSTNQMALTTLEKGKRK